MQPTANPTEVEVIRRDGARFSYTFPTVEAADDFADKVLELMEDGTGVLIGPLEFPEQLVRSHHPGGNHTEGDDDERRAD